MPTTPATLPVTDDVCAPPAATPVDPEQVFDDIARLLARLLAAEISTTPPTK